MSGIAGVFCFDGAPAPVAAVEAMTRAMAARGPDGINVWAEGSVALGHCMLRTTPESQGEVQPLVSDDGDLVLVMDGRIDNRGDLVAALGASGVRIEARTDDVTDAALVLQCFRLWGDDFAARLLGDFALAIWSRRRGELLCVRDHLGVRPFYWHRGPNFVAFASADEALLQVPGVPAVVNEEFVAYALYYPFAPRDPNAGWLKGIQRLPPGSSLKLDRAGTERCKRYWQLQPQPELRLARDQDYVEAFDELFGQAVAACARCSGEVGVMLSGGIDSASVAAVMRDATGRPARVYSAARKGESPACEETRNIKAIVRHLGADARYLPVPEFDGMVTVEDLRRFAWGQSHPTSNSILLPAMVYLMAQRTGCRVVLDGIDGDLATWTPTRYLTGHLRAGQWTTAWREARLASANNTYLQSRPPWAILGAAAWEAWVPAALRGLKARLWDPGPRQQFRDSLIAPQFARRVGVRERLLETRAEALRVSRLGLQEQHIWALNGGITRGTEGFDRVAGHFGIEPRHPWLDRRLIEFMVRLPLDQKVRGGWTKSLVRRSMSARLPTDVAWHRGKSHLGFELSQRLLNDSGQLEKLTPDNLGALAPYVDRPSWQPGLTAGARNQGYAMDRILGILALRNWADRIARGARP